MKRFSYLVFFLSLIAIFNKVQAQKSYINGYVLQLNGDTSWGLLSNAESNKTPDKVWFKPNDSAEANLLLPTTIKGFGFASKRFWSALVKMDSTPYFEKSLTDVRELSLYSDSTFVEQLVIGNKCLYKKLNADGKLHFYIGSVNELQLLEYKKYLTKIDSKDVITENRKYLGQLNFYLQDCAGIYDYLQTITYAQKDLLKLFTYYSKCQQTNALIVGTEDKGSVSFALLGGINRTYLSADGNANFDYLTKANLSSSINLCVGAQMRYLMGGYANRWFTDFETFYTTYEVSGTYSSYSGPNQSKTYSPTYGSKQLQLNFALGRQLNSSFGTYFYKMGALASYKLAESNTMQVKEHYFSQNVSTSEITLASTRLIEVGIFGALGVNIKKISLEFRMQITNGPSKAIDLGINRVNSLLVLGYRL